MAIHHRAAAPRGEAPHVRKSTGMWSGARGSSFLDLLGVGNEARQSFAPRDNSSDAHSEGADRAAKPLRLEIGGDSVTLVSLLTSEAKSSPVTSRIREAPSERSWAYSRPVMVRAPVPGDGDGKMLANSLLTICSSATQAEVAPEREAPMRLGRGLASSYLQAAARATKRRGLPDERVYQRRHGRAR